MVDTENLKVHGSIFFLLRKFVISTYDESMWLQLNVDAHTEGQDFMMTESYPLKMMNDLIGAASRRSKIPVEDLKKGFGEFLVPDLFQLYKSFIEPSWRTFELLEYTEGIMHNNVRKLNSTAAPPILQVTKINTDTLMINYYSKRKMGSLAIGIITGIAKYYKEDSNIEIISLTPPDAERVQIKVERNVYN